jgi:hypothetical protein
MECRACLEKILRVKIMDLKTFRQRVSNSQQLPAVVFVFVFRVGPAVTQRMYCSLPRLIVLTPL